VNKTNEQEQAFPVTEYDRARFVGLMRVELSDREFEALSLLYGFHKSGERFTRNDTALLMGISASRVGKLEQAALRKMRHPRVLEAMQSGLIVIPMEDKLLHAVGQPMCRDAECVCRLEQ